MVYTPKQLNDFDIIADLREFATLADKRVKRKDLKLSQKVMFQKLAKLARAEAQKMYGEMEFDKAA